MSRVEKPVVLLVDDNEATCTLITAILQRDYTVEVANEGAEALESIKTRHFAAILLDLRMPGLDGFAVLDSLKQTCPDLLRRILIVTASLAARDMERLKPYHVCGIVPKPFDVDTLLHAVKQCVGDGAGPRMNILSSGVILFLADLLGQVSR